jgi:hypothetical protein
VIVVACSVEVGVVAGQRDAKINREIRLRLFRGMLVIVVRGRCARFIE